jgi:hypothetical protein
MTDNKYRAGAPVDLSFCPLKIRHGIEHDRKRVIRSSELDTVGLDKQFRAVKLIVGDTPTDAGSLFDCGGAPVDNRFEKQRPELLYFVVVALDSGGKTLPVSLKRDRNCRVKKVAQIRRDLADIDIENRIDRDRQFIVGAGREY